MRFHPDDPRAKQHHHNNNAQTQRDETTAPPGGEVTALQGSEPSPWRQTSDHGVYQVLHSGGESRGASEGITNNILLLLITHFKK